MSNETNATPGTPPDSAPSQPVSNAVSPIEGAKIVAEALGMPANHPGTARLAADLAATKHDQNMATIRRVNAEMDRQDSALYKRVSAWRSALPCGEVRKNAKGKITHRDAWAVAMGLVDSCLFKFEQSGLSSDLIRAECLLDLITGSPCWPEIHRGVAGEMFENGTYRLQLFEEYLLDDDATGTPMSFEAWIDLMEEDEDDEPDPDHERDEQWGREQDRAWQDGTE